MDGVSTDFSNFRLSAPYGAAGNGAANTVTPDDRPLRLEDEPDVFQSGVLLFTAPQLPAGGTGAESNVDLGFEAMLMAGDGVTYAANLQYQSLQNGLLGWSLDVNA